MRACEALEPLLELPADSLPQPKKVPARPADGQGKRIVDLVPDAKLLKQAEEIAAKHGLEMRWILPSNKDKHVVIVRAEIARVLRKDGARLMDISAVLRRDHSTVVTMLKRRYEACKCVRSE